MSPNNFRGTGQNGQILEDDMKCWSRRLHFLEPEDLFKVNKKPSRTLTIGFFLAVTGLLVIIHSIKSSINKIVSKKIIQTDYLKFAAGLFLFVPGLYIILVNFLIFCLG